MSAELELVGVTGDPVLDAVAGHGDPLIFEVPDMPACMLHMMLRLEESRNKEQRKAGINYDFLDSRASRSSGNPAAVVNAAGDWRWSALVRHDLDKGIAY
jgi:hypothetical protein